MTKKELKIVAELVIKIVKRELPKAIRSEIKSVVQEQLNATMNGMQNQSAEEFSFMNEDIAMNDLDITEEDDQKTAVNKILEQTKQNSRPMHQRYSQTGPVGYGGNTRQQPRQQPQQQQPQQSQPRRQPVVDPSRFGYGNMNDMRAGAGRFDDPNYGFDDGSNQQQQPQQINAQKQPQFQGQQQQQQSQRQPQNTGPNNMPSFIQNAVNNAKTVVDQSKKHDGSRRSFMPGG